MFPGRRDIEAAGPEPLADLIDALPAVLHEADVKASRILDRRRLGTAQG